MSSDSTVPRPPQRRSPPRRTSEAPAAVGERDARDATESTVRPRRDDGAQVVAFPHTHRRRRIEPTEATAETAVAPAAELQAVGDADEPVHATSAPPEVAKPETPVERPQFLASELLKQDWHPRHPLRRTSRWGTLAVGAAGAIAILAAGGGSLVGLLLAAVLAACAVVGAAPLEPARRTVILASVATLGTATSAWLRSDEPSAPLLLGCLVVASSALFFRAAHRTSRLARALVGVGVGATALWLTLTGGVESLVVTSLEWQVWVGPALRVALGAAVVSTLLTFLDPTGHGGAWIAGGSLLVWSALDASGAVARALWPVRGTAEALSDPVVLATLASPFLTAVAAVGLCQVWVLLSRPPTTGKRETPPSRATIA